MDFPNWARAAAAAPPQDEPLVLVAAAAGVVVLSALAAGVALSPERARQLGQSLIRMAALARALAQEAGDDCDQPA